jgi:hypothetical protein
MMITVLFLVIFILGPLSFRVLTREAPSQSGSRRLAVLAAVCGIGGLGLRYGGSAQWGSNVVLTVAGIALIWFAWIAILAFGAQALRRADRGLSMQRWTAVVGYAGTTVPWFGLAWASAFAK